jgi:hypothetical protein
LKPNRIRLEPVMIEPFRTINSFSGKDLAVGAVGVIAVIFFVAGLIWPNIIGVPTTSNKGDILAESKAQTTSEPESASRMKLQNLWRYEVELWDRCVRTYVNRDDDVCATYFICDYTRKVCQRGYRSHMFMFLYTLLDGNDRRTEIAHFFCAATTCLSFDTGAVTDLNFPGENNLVKDDMPQDCIGCDDWLKANVPWNDLWKFLQWPRSAAPP